MIEYYDDRDYNRLTEYYDDRDYDRLTDNVDYDEADRALLERLDSDNEIAWKIQIHEFSHAIRESPLPGTTFPEEFRRRFKIHFSPFPAEPTAAQLRNLYSDSAYNNAKKCAASNNPDITWFGAQFLHWRNEAIGRYCYNPQCLLPLPLEPKRRGRPRLYCSAGCKDAAKKRRAYHEANPKAAERLKPMIVPGIPIRTRHDRNEISSLRGWLGPRETRFKAPWAGGNSYDEEEAGLKSSSLGSHFSRWISKHAKKNRPSYTATGNWGKKKRSKIRKEIERAVGASIEELILEMLNDGHVFASETQEFLEMVLGKSVENIVTAEEPEDDAGDPGSEPLPQRAASDLYFESE